MKEVFCFGELLLRLSPKLNRQWIKDGNMPVFLGGAELNVATALALWNVPVTYCTALPDHYLSKEIEAELKTKGIGTGKIIWSGSRIGTYYLPQGADMKAAGVIYDRSYSSFASLKVGEVDWNKILESVSWFHFSAINPALTKETAAVCKEALEAASAKGITISVDLNYRAKLWQYGLQPVDVMPELVQHCDVVMGNIWAAETMLGIPIASGFQKTKENCLQQATETSKAIQERFPKCKQVANTFRFDKEEGIQYYATLFTEDHLFISQEYTADAIVDKVGSGDCFMGGLIYSNHKGLQPQQVINFATTAAFKKLFIKGDTTTTTVEEIKNGITNYA